MADNQPGPSSWKPQRSETGPGPSLQSFKRNPERAYTGPDPKNLGGTRTPEQAQQYFKHLAATDSGPPLPRWGRVTGIGGWILGGFAAFYMILYADFGDREHVFSEPRRQWHQFTNNMFTLSDKERNLMGLQKPLKSQQEEKV